MQGVNDDFIEHGDDFISIYHNVFPKTNCDQIIKKFEFLDQACLHNDEVKRLHEEWKENGHGDILMDGKMQFKNASGGRMDRKLRALNTKVLSSRKCAAAVNVASGITVS